MENKYIDSLTINEILNLDFKLNDFVELDVFEHFGIHLNTGYYELSQELKNRLKEKNKIYGHNKNELCVIYFDDIPLLIYRIKKYINSDTRNVKVLNSIKLKECIIEVIKDKLKNNRHINDKCYINTTYSLRDYYNEEEKYYIKNNKLYVEGVEDAIKRIIEINNQPRRFVGSNDSYNFILSDNRNNYK